MSTGNKLAVCRGNGIPKNSDEIKNARSRAFFLEKPEGKKENSPIIFRFLFSYFLGIINY